VSISWDASTDAMRAIFSPAAEVQAWLDAEAALARAEARNGVIPKEAAAEITAKADVALLDLDGLRGDIRTAVHPIMPLVTRFAAVCDGGAGEYVHWGATTQDITDTGVVLRLRQADAVLAPDLERLVGVLRDLAVTHRDTPMAGRTHAQHAVPITFGYKLAVWVDELQRHQATLARLREEVFVGQLGGATGTLASLGPVGLAVRRDFMDELGLAEPTITWHVTRDRLASYTFALALIASAIQRAALEVVALQRTEIAEVFEPFHHGKVGSSTMPHKRNPALSEALWTLGELVRNDVRTALSGLGSLHERDKAVFAVEMDYLPRVCSATHRMLELAIRVFEGLVVDADRMRTNLEAGRGQLFSERVMMRLAERIGRQRAHDVVYEAAMSAFDRGEHLRDAVGRDPVIAEAFAPNELDALFDLGEIGAVAGVFVDRVCRPEDAG
jgi:adenylosuccinate lyase